MRSFWVGVVWVTIGVWAPAGCGWAQGLDSNYIQDFTNLLTVRTYGISKQQAFRVRATGLQSPLDYQPNVAAGIGVGFNYKWLGIGIALQLPEDPSKTTKGTTEQLDIQLLSYNRKNGFDLYFQNYRGFYLANTTSQLGPAYPTEYYLRPDLRTTAYGGNFYYFFNHDRFSYRGAFVQNERQLKTASSWVLLGNLASYRVQADSAFVPQTLHETVRASGGQRYTDVQFLQVGGLGGYAVTFVAKQQFYVSLSALVGLAAVNYAADSLGTPLGEGWRLSGRGNFRAGLGYNGPVWFGGISVVADAYNLRFNDDLQLEYTVSQARLSVGRRILARLW
jgi:Domain of unknown function (DUF4421)